jgi:putative transposase
MIEEAIGQLTPFVGTTKALASVGADRATWYRQHRQSPAPPRPERIATPQPRALTPVERKEIKATWSRDCFEGTFR